MRLLKIRKRVQKRRNYAKRRGRWKKLKAAWKKPRGIQSKLRKKYKGHAKHPSLGDSSPKAVRGLSPAGLEEVRVFNPSQLEGMDPKKQTAIMAAAVGTRKREEIVKKASKLKIEVLNR